MIALVNGPGSAIAYVSGIRDSLPVHVEIVEPPSSGPSPFATTIKAACGDYLALLDENTSVTDAWLDQLVALIEADPKIGAVGPMSNDAPPPQRAEGMDPADLDALQTFASRWRAEHRGQWLISRQLGNTCVVAKRRVVESVKLDGVRSPGELAARIQAAGYSLAVARDLYVHHLPRSTDGNPHLSGNLLLEGHMRLVPKGMKHDPPRAAVPSIPGAPRLAPGDRRPGVSLTMIVRNEEANLEACLASAEGLFAETIVVDTGSTDRTREIAQQFHAKVVDFPWIDDFAAARNAALAHATCRHAFWLDADDRIDETNRARLRALIARVENDGAAAYVMKQLSVSQDRFETTTSADHVRLFPVRDDVRWTYRVHEQILPALRAAGVPVSSTEIGIGHVGYVDPRQRDAKLERNLRILLAELRERPGDPFVLFNIGWVALDRREAKTSLGYLRVSLAASAPRDAIVRKLYVLIARAYQMLGDHSGALGACLAGLALEPDDAELLFREALIRREAGDLGGAECCWRRILEHARPTKFASVVTGIYGHLTRRNLAAVVALRGGRDEAAQLWREVLAECPGDHEALATLGRLGLPHQQGAERQ